MEKNKVSDLKTPLLEGDEEDPYPRYAATMSHDELKEMIDQFEETKDPSPVHARVGRMERLATDFSQGSVSRRLFDVIQEVRVKTDMSMKDSAIVDKRVLDRITEEIDKSKVLEHDVSKTYDPLEEEEFEVYPLSQKYNRKKENRMLYIRLFAIFIVVFIFFILVIDLWRGNIFQHSPIRLGFFADKITEASVSMKEIDSYRINTRNCNIYLLENTENDTESMVYVSASRDTNVEIYHKNGTQFVRIIDEVTTVGCYVEIRIPGGSYIRELSLRYRGDRIPDLMLYDNKHKAPWKTPLTIQNLIINIKDAFPNIYFLNSHKVSYLEVSGTYCNWNFDDLKIGNMVYNVNSGVLSVIQNSYYDQNKVVINTPTGSHWLAGSVTNINSTGCPENGGDQKSLENPFSTSHYCTSAGYVCSDSSKYCPDVTIPAEKDQGEFKITLNDGPVEFSIKDSSTDQSVSFYPKIDSFSIASREVLRENHKSFSEEPSDPRIYIYEVIGPGYSKTWVHSSLKQYIEARPWLLSMLSMSILRPSYYRNTLIHIPGGGTWPSRKANGIAQDSYISENLAKMSFTRSGHIVALKENGTYYEVVQNVDYEYEHIEIPFLNNNRFIIVSLVVTFAISIYSVIVVSYAFSKMLKYFTLDHNRKIAELRRYAITKKFNETKSTVDKKEKEKLILKLGIFTTELVHDEENEETVKSVFNRKDNEDQSASLSFFQTLELYINWWVRSRTNSFWMFLTNIYPTTDGFRDIETSENFENSAVSLDYLKMKYTEFWIKYGWVPREIEDETWLLEEYNLKIENRQTTATQAYTNIRWKTPFERNDELNPMLLDKAKAQKAAEAGGQSVISQFLLAECKPSVLKGDFILVKDLKRRYEEYCSQRQVGSLFTPNIVSSLETEKFGARYEPNFKIPYVRGIAWRKVPCSANDYAQIKKLYIPGMVRTADVAAKNTFLRILNYFMDLRYSSLLIGPDGIITNLVVVIVHLLLLFLVPFIICIAQLWSLLQVGLINSGAYNTVFDIGDVFNSSSYDFWLDHLAGRGFFYVFLVIWLLFFFCGLVELVSYYFTQRKNTGRYPVVKTKAKRIVSSQIWWMLFVAFYTAYISVVLIWCILGAVLNPQKFLPMAIGSLVFIAFSYRLRARLIDAHNEIIKNVNSSVDEELKLSLVDTMEKQKTKIEKANVDFDETSSVETFQNELNEYMDVNNFILIDKPMIEKMIDGNTHPLLKIISKNHGLNYNISLGILGMIIENPYTILNSVYRLSSELSVNNNLNLTIAEALLNKFYLKKTSKIYRVIRPVTKKLVRSIFPNFPVTAIDQMHTVVTEGELDPLEYVCINLGIPSHIFTMAKALSLGDNELLKQSICDFKDYLWEPSQIESKLFDGLEILRSTTIKNSYSQLRDKIFKYKGLDFRAQYAIAAFKGNKNLTKNTLVDSAKLIFEAYPNEPYAKKLANYSLAMNLLATGESINYEDLITENLSDRSASAINLLFSLSKGDLVELQKSLVHMGFKHQNNALIEFCNLILERDTDLIYIGQRFGVPSQELEMFKLLVETMLAYEKHTILTRTHISHQEHSEHLELLEELLFKYLSTNLHIRQLKGEARLKAAMRSIFRTLRFSKNKINTLKAVITLAVCFITNISISRFENSPKLSNSFRLVAELVDVTEDQLELLIDILSGNPYRIFKATSAVHKTREANKVPTSASMLVNLEESPLKLKRDQRKITDDSCSYTYLRARITTLAETFNCEKYILERWGTLWINSFELFFRGKAYLNDLAHCLELDSSFLHILINKRNLTEISRRFRANLGLATSRSSEFSRLLRDKVEVNLKISTFLEKWITKFQSDGIEVSTPQNQDRILPDYPISIGAINLLLHNDPEFVRMLKCVVELKQGRYPTFKYLFQNDEILAYMMNKIYTSMVNADWRSICSTLVFIPCFLTYHSASETKSEHFYGPNPNVIQIYRHHRFQRLTTEFQWLQTMLLFTGMNLEAAFNSRKYPCSEINTNLRNLISTIQAVWRNYEPENVNLQQLDHKTLLPYLLESGFFKGLPQNFFKKYYSSIDSDKADNLDSIFGIMFGMARRDNIMILHHLLKLLKHTEIDQRYIKGALGFIAKETRLEKDMRFVLQHMKIDKTLAWNLVHLVSTDIDKDYFNPALKICERHCSKPRLVAALTATIKGDLSNMEYIASKLKVDTNILTLVTACSKQRLDLLADSFKHLAEAVYAKNINSVKTVISLACNDCSVIEDLPQLVPMTLNKDQKKLLFSLFYLNVEGTKIKDLYVPHVNHSMSHHHKYIQSCLLKQLKPQKEVYEEHDPLNIHTLIKACWGDGLALKEIADTVEDYFNSNNSGEETKLSHFVKEHPSRIEEIIKRSLRSTFEEAFNSVKSSYRNIANNLATYRAQMEELSSTEIRKYFRRYGNNEEEYSLVISDKLSQGNINEVAIKESTAEIILKLGCTVPYGQLRKLEGYYLKCNSWSDSGRTVCLYWALTCHKDHSFTFVSRGQTLNLCEWKAYKLLNRDENEGIEDLDMDISSDENQRTGCPEIPIKDFSSVQVENINVNTPNILMDRETSIQRKQDFEKHLKLKSFEQEFHNYKAHEFIADLTKILKPKITEAQNLSKENFNSKFTRYDRSLQRNVHLYEHIILLAHGFCRPGLIEILVDSEVSDLLISVLSVQQGDFENFMSANVDYKFKGDQNWNNLQKAATLIMLVKGNTLFCKIPELSGLSNSYDKLFEILFGNKIKSIQAFHYMCLLRELKYINYIKTIATISPIEKYSWDSDSNIWNLNRLLDEGFHLDAASISWFSVLTRISLGEFRSFVYIAKKLNIPKLKISTYKAIWSKDYNAVIQLFKGIHIQEFTDICDIIYLLWNCRLEGITKLCFHPISNGVEDDFKGITQTLETIYEAMRASKHEKEALESLDLKYLNVNDKKLDAKTKGAVFGFNAMLRSDVKATHKLINARSDLHEIIDLAHNIIDLSQKATKIEVVKSFYDNYRGLKHSGLGIPETMLHADALTTVKDEDEEVKGEKISLVKYQSKYEGEENLPTHLFILRQLISALNGNTQSLGFMYDIIRAQGHSYTGTLLGFISRPDAPFLFDQPISTPLIQFTAKEIFRKIFDELGIPEPTSERFYRSKLHLYTLSLMRKYDDEYDSLLGIQKFGDVILDPKLYDTLKGVAKHKDVNLSSLFKAGDKATSIVKAIPNFKLDDREVTLDTVEEEFSYFTNKASQAEHKEATISVQQLTKKESLAREVGFKETENGVQLPTHKLFQILFKIMKGDLEAFLELVKIMSPCFKNINGAPQLLTILYLVMDSKYKEITPDIEEDLLALLIYAGYAEKKVNKDHFLDAAASKYKHSLNNITKIWEFATSLVAVINRRHGTTSLEDTRAMVRRLWKSIKEVVLSSDPNNSTSNDDEINEEMKSEGKAESSPKEHRLSIKYPTVDQHIPDLELQTDMILYIIGLVKNDLSYLEAIAGRFGFFEKDLVLRLYHLLCQHKYTLFKTGIKGLPELPEEVKFCDIDHQVKEFATQSVISFQDNRVLIDDFAHNELASIKAKAHEIDSDNIETSVYKILFDHFDSDNWGFIDYIEFWEIFKYMGLYVNKERTLKLFAKTDVNGNGTMEFDEFEYAMNQLKIEIAYDTLKKLNQTSEELVWVAISALIFLLLLFIFIFIGISAFGRAAEFNAVVSSLLPLSAGMIASLPSFGTASTYRKVRNVVHDLIVRMKTKN